MLGVTYVYIGAIFAFYVYVDFFFFFLAHLYCLVGCLGMVVWTHAGHMLFLDACVSYF